MSTLRESVVGRIKKHPVLHRNLKNARTAAFVTKHSLAARVPALIQPATKNLTVAITARCNYRCEGCLYERSFMLGESLPLPVVRDMLDDAAAARVDNVRFYGGEPLLHPDLPAMIEHSRKVGVDPYVTTNGALLGKRIGDLYDAGLRFMTIGLYGYGESYDNYVSRPGAHAVLDKNLTTVRERYGDKVRMRFNWLLHRHSCNVSAIDEALAFAEKHDAPMQVDLVHYSLPYFTEGEERHLQFRPEDRALIEPVVLRLLEAKRKTPHLVDHTELGLRSIADWLIKGPEMKVPCDKYEMLWIGADGTVQLCYVMFELGNLHKNRLSEILYSAEHKKAARGAFCLDCENCHCGYDSRITKHAPSRRLYQVALPGEQR